MSLSRMSHSLVNISSKTDSQILRSIDTASSTAAPSSSAAAIDLIDKIWEESAEKFRKVVRGSDKVVDK